MHRQILNYYTTNTYLCWFKSRPSIKETSTATISHLISQLEKKCSWYINEFRTPITLYKDTRDGQCFRQEFLIPAARSPRGEAEDLDPEVYNWQQNIPQKQYNEWGPVNIKS